jgi:hypothetical protein
MGRLRLSVWRPCAAQPNETGVIRHDDPAVGQMQPTEDDMDLDAESLGLAMATFATAFAYLAARARVKERGAERPQGLFYATVSRRR